MARPPEEVKECEVCGASIYAEMIKKGTADFLLGKLLCPHCLQQRKRIAAVNPAAVFKDDQPAQVDEPIALAIEDDSDESGPAPSRIQAFGGSGISSSTTYGSVVADRQYNRSLLRDSPNATRCRTFHCKLTDSSMAHLNEMINEWVDANEDMQVKFATSCIGMVEGKSSNDAHLIVTIFY